MLIECVASSGELISVELVELVFRQAHLCGGRLVPPKNLVDDFLSEGSARYDHWREISWKGFSLTNQQYDDLRSRLAEQHGCKISRYSDEHVDRLLWEAVQTSEQVGKSVDVVLPTIRRIDMYQRLLDVMREIPEEVGVDNDLWEDISLRLSEEINKLQ